MKKAIAFGVAGGLVLLIVLACEPVPPPQCSQSSAFNATFHFEDCTSDLCGFDVVSGSARRVATFHPGEHGMQIDAGSNVSVSFDGPLVARGSETLRLVARCDAGASLVAIETLLHRRAGSTSTSMADESVTVPATPQWVRYDESFFDVGSQSTMTDDFAAARVLQFTVQGSGSCTLDEIAYETFAQSCQATEDGGTDASLLDARVDARDGAADADGGASLYAQCSSNASCALLGASATCLTQFPGGVCTHRCTLDSECGGTGIGLCVQGTCFPQCQQGDRRCDAFGADCVAVDPSIPSRRICNPSCFPAGATPPSASYPSCSASVGCDVWTGGCGSPAPTAGENGAPCTTDSDCSGGQCHLENDPATGPSGFVGGYCTSPGYRLPDSAYVTGSAIPQGNCPNGSAPFPSSDARAGDATQCFATCTDASGCRAGYTCNHLVDPVTGMPRFTNGFCLPIDCNAPGMNCPTGYSCQTSIGDAAVVTGICVADAAPDGGVGDGG